MKKKIHVGQHWDQQIAYRKKKKKINQIIDNDEAFFSHVGNLIMQTK